MTPADFTAWLDTMKADRGWSQRESARQLGCSSTYVVKLKTGVSKIPRYIGLACRALTERRREWTPKDEED